MVGVALFWTHVAVVMFALSVGLIFPLPMAIGLIVLHRLHMWVFGGCVLTKLEQKVRAIPDGADFMRHLAGKITGSEISERQGRVLDYGLTSMAVVIALVHHL